MSDNDLSELLDELRSAIAGADGLADDRREHLDGLVRRVEAAADPEEDDDDGIFDHLDDAVSQFEAEHVTLVATINRIANVLSAGGI